MIALTARDPEFQVSENVLIYLLYQKLKKENEKSSTPIKTVQYLSSKAYPICHKSNGWYPSGLALQLP